MKIVVAKDPEEVARRGAEVVARVIDSRPDAVLGLPTGRTAVPFYAALAELSSRGAVDLSRARGFNLDELILPPEHPASFRSFMEEHAWQRPSLPGPGLRREHCALPHGAAEDPVAECRRYEAALQAEGGLDMAILGVGEDGHVAYNLPGLPRGEAHVVVLPQAVAARLDVPPTWRPARAMTLGISALRSARRLVLMATGAAKAPAIRALLQGPEDPRWPCSLLRGHPAFDVILDPQAHGAASTHRETCQGETLR